MRWTLLLLIPAAAAAVYQPGTPGAPWSVDELLIAKAKIRWIISNPVDALKMVEGGAEELAKYESQPHSAEGSRKDAIIPNLPKIVRLTFHDCIKEVSGAGCNGCMNFDNMGNLFSMAQCSRQGTCKDIDGGIHPDNGPFVTDNNNLLWVAKVLEGVYKDEAFGHTKLLPFNVSLYESGKSRADLWAFAGYVALQMGTENNNMNCNPDKPAPCPNQVDENSPPCNYELPPLGFKTGRSDCTPSCTGDNDYPFCTTEAEIHPNPHGNGEETVRFFEENFGFKGRQAAALMGAHTLGHANEFNSMFRHYPWTAQGKKHLNNRYYQNIALKENYRNLLNKGVYILNGYTWNPKNCDLPISGFMGDAYGNPFSVGFAVRSERRTVAHGPWNWALHSSGCSTVACAEIKAAGEEYDKNSCCHYLEFCTKVPQDKCPVKPLKKFACTEENPEDCTEINNFMRINMLSVDVGLYYNFTTDADGRPTGCPGMDNKRWVENRSKQSAITDCEMNTAPAGDDEGNTMADIMQLFAEDNEQWISEFIPVFDAMLENGVDIANLEASPTEWVNANCNDKRKICKL